MRTAIAAACLAIFAGQLSAQTRTDSLLAAGFRHLKEFTSSHDVNGARAAYRDFDAVLKKDADNADAHLGMGLTYTAVEHWQLEPLGVNDASRPVNNTLAVQHLVTALKNGADWHKAAVALVTVSRREYDPERMQAAIEGLTSVKSGDELLRAAIGELLISLKKRQKAAALLRGVTVPGARRVLGVALLLQKGEVQAGGAEYLAALGSADSLSLQEFVRDARWIADPQEAAEWNRSAPQQLRARLATFWTRRAVKAGVSVPERLATHFERVVHALEEFSYYRQRVGVRAALAIDPLIDARDYDVDDRAFTYVKYGEPDERITTIDGAYPHNQSWVYRNLSDHPISFDFFLLPSDPHGWTLTADVVRCDPHATVPYSPQFLEDRLAVDLRYAKILAGCKSRMLDVVDVRLMAMPIITERETYLRRAMVQENGVPRTRKDLPINAEVLQFAGDLGSTEVTALVTWPLMAISRQNDVERVTISLMIADTLGGSGTVLRDTTISVRVSPTTVNGSGRVYLKLSVPPHGGELYRIAVRDGGDPGVLSIIGDSITVRPLQSSKLALSDIAIVSGEDGSWIRNGHRYSLLPTGAHGPNFGIYYEVYGVPSGSKYKTTLTFTPKDEGLAALIKKLKGVTKMSFTFVGENQGGEAVVRELRQLKSGLPAGKYLLTMLVQSSGQSSQVSRRLVLRSD